MTRIPPDTGVLTPGLAKGELHVWVADLDTRERTPPHDLLSAAERERAARFVNQRDGARWARSRALLRLLLGGYLSIDPAGLCFELGEHGKPELAATAASAGQAAFGESKLRFNLSHSGGVGLCVFALDSAVGVDVETPGRNIDVLAVARRALGDAAAERLRPLDDERREREFLRAWVRHEAALKCLGVGLARATTGANDQECWMIDIDVGDRATATVAAQRAPAKVEHWRWELCSDGG